MPTENPQDKQLGMLSHILGIITCWLGPLIIWLIKKDQSPYVGEQAKEALNFQLTMLIGYIVSGLLFIIFIGVILYFVVLVASIVFGVKAAIAANKGEDFRYPFALRLIK